MVHKRVIIVMMFNYNMVLLFALIDFHKLQILGIKPSLLFFIIFISLFLICYLVFQPLIAILVTRHTINLLTFLLSSLFILMLCLILLLVEDSLSVVNIEQRSLILKNALLAIGSIGSVITFFYYTKHLLKLK